MAICTMVYSLTTLIYTEVAATAFGNIGWKFYMVRSFPSRQDILETYSSPTRSLLVSAFLDWSGSILHFQRQLGCRWRKSLPCSGSRMRSWSSARIFRQGLMPESLLSKIMPLKRLEMARLARLMALLTTRLWS